MFTDHDSYAGMSFCTNGATALQTGPTPLTNQDYWGELVNETRVDVLAFCLGTSDAAIGLWDEQQFEKDYKAILTQIMNISSYGNLKAEVFVMIPPPYYIDDGVTNQTAVNQVIPSLIHQIANDLGIDEDHVFNTFEMLGGANLSSYELMCDG